MARSPGKVSTAFERQQRILGLLAERGTISVDELVKQLQVSTMTVHRDLDLLAAEKRLRKVHGGAAAYDNSLQEDQCYFCHSLISSGSHTKVTLHLTDGSHRHACCAHCGLLGLSHLGKQVSTAIVTDFLYGRAINARSATYVVEPDLQICCAPTTLVFQNNADALRFQRGFGGQVLPLSEALTVLHDEMALTAQRQV